MKLYIPVQLIINMSEPALTANLREYWTTGCDSLAVRKYNSAANEFFKAFITACDIAIYRKLRLLPADHGERFGILKINFPDLYRLYLSLFQTYRKSYTLRLSADDARRLQQGVSKVATTIGIKID